MRINWKVIVGVVFLVGGFGCAHTDMGAATFGMIVGSALIVWWGLGWKKVSKTAQHLSQSLPAKQPAAPANKPVVPPAYQPPAPRTNTQIPQTKDGAPLAYKYNVSFVLSNTDVSAVSKNLPQLTAKQIGQEIHLFSEGVDLGILTERADMVSDWLKRGDPYLAVIDQVSGGSCQITLAFFRDKQKQYANREQTVIALTGYKAEQKQDVITSLAAGDELEPEEDYEKEGRVVVSYTGDVIGSLPKKYAVRFINDGAALIVFDHIEEDDKADDIIYKPFVKIYW